MRPKKRYFNPNKRVIKMDKEAARRMYTCDGCDAFPVRVEWRRNCHECGKSLCRTCLPDRRHYCRDCQEAINEGRI